MAKVRRETLIAAGCFGWLAGLGLSVVPGFSVRPEEWLVAGICLAGAVLGRRRFVAVVAVIGLGVILGLWRGGSFEDQLSGYRLLVGQKLELTGIVTEDASYNDRGQRDFRLERVEIGSSTLPGQVRVTTYSPGDFRRGDRVLANGKLAEGFGNYQAALYFAEAQTTQVGGDFIGWLRRQFAASVLTNIPEPQASLGLGFLLGIKSQLPDELNDRLKIVGLTHIVVASGYNLTILIRLARRLFAKRSKYQAMVASMGLMAGFVAVTGFSPSMSRAALVTGLSLAAWYYGRRIHPAVVLLLSAAITAGLNPLYLWSDLGWWLSFLAFAGVMLVAPLIQKQLFKEREPKLLGQVIIETVSAQLTTLPLIVSVFGTLAVWSLPANVLVVPLVPLAMLLTALAGLAGWLLPAAASYAAVPATWLLGYMTDLVDWFAAAPGASLATRLDALGMLTAYAGLALIGAWLKHRTGHNFLSSNHIE